MNNSIGSNSCSINSTSNTNMSLQQIYDTCFPNNVFKSKSSLKNQPNSDFIQKMFMFEYKNDKNTNKDGIQCIPSDQKVTTRDNKTWIKFSFKNMVLFGTVEQKQSFHKFRKAYINKLFKSLCNPHQNCNYEIVGSDSPVSDMDITIYEMIENKHQDKTNDMDNVNISKSIEDVLVNIYKNHHDVFDQTLEELFDCNIYLTSFFYYSKNNITDGTMYTCIPKATNKNHNSINNMYLCFLKHDSGYFDYEQRKWALSKFVKLISREVPKRFKSDILDILLKYFDGYYKLFQIVEKFILKKHGTFIKRSNATTFRYRSDKIRDVRQARRSINAFNRENSVSSADSGIIRNGENTYYNAERNVYKETSDPQELLNDIERKNAISEVLSKTAKLSTAEKDTYSTQGASFAHVVNRNEYPEITKHLSIYMLIDAIFDNLGFIGQLIFHEEQCNDEFVQFTKVMKVSKYVERICNDLVLIMAVPEANNYKQNKPTEFQNIATLSKDLNEKRKKMLPMTETSSSIDQFKNILREYSNSRIGIIPNIINNNNKVIKRSQSSQSVNSYNSAHNNNSNTFLKDHIDLVNLFRDIIVFTFDQTSAYDTVDYQQRYKAFQLNRY